jgi:hypothetical protein
MTEQLGLPCMESTAAFSPCRTWRYTLHRQWSDGPGVAFLMFNPSTADEAQDDPTIRRCRGFAIRWNYARMTILNLFAIRGTDPRIVGRVEDPVGPDNDLHILSSVATCSRVVVSWGCGSHMKGQLRQRPAAVVSMLRANFPTMPIDCLGYSADGSPRHPLMLHNLTQLHRFEVKP